MRKCFIKSMYIVLSLLLLRTLMAASMGIWSSGFNDQLGQVAFVMAGVLGHFGASAIEYVIELIRRPTNESKSAREYREPLPS